jgi:hypothetical protein
MACLKLRVQPTDRCSTSGHSRGALAARSFDPLSGLNPVCTSGLVRPIQPESSAGWSALSSSSTNLNPSCSPARTTPAPERALRFLFMIPTNEHIRRALPLANDSDPAPPPHSIPKGLHHSAQGCDPALSAAGDHPNHQQAQLIDPGRPFDTSRKSGGATLGVEPNRDLYLEEVAAAIPRSCSSSHPTDLGNTSAIRSENGQKQSDSPSLSGTPNPSGPPTPQVDQAIPSSSIPKGLPHSAQGCEERATLGFEPRNALNSNGAAASTPNSFNSLAAPSTPPHPWSLQPNEPTAAYQLFTAWLQLPPPRRFRSAAATLGCSIYRLRRLSSHYHWKGRAAAFDQHHANISSLALDQLLRDEQSSWKERTERFRIQEWLLHEEMLRAASAAVAELLKRPCLPSLRDIIKLYELAFQLGRLACGLPLDPGDQSAPVAPSTRPDVEAALNKIYGPDDSAQPTTSPPQQTPSEPL